MKQGMESKSHKLFQSSCGDSLLPLLPAAVISMDASSVHPAVLPEALLQQSPPVGATQCCMPMPNSPVNLKFQELAAEEIE